MTASKHMISSSEHYTVVVALMISLITTFLLGFLLTETLWGGGLRYFSDLSREGRQKKAYIQAIQNQLQAQQAKAQVLVVVCRDWHICVNRCSELDTSTDRNNCAHNCDLDCPPTSAVDTSSISD